MNAMKYKGYAARIEYDAHDRIFVGHLAGIRDIVGFHGAAVEERETAFHEAVVNYLAACAKLGQHPNKQVSGKILLRVPPEIHSAAIMMAKSEDGSHHVYKTPWQGDLRINIQNHKGKAKAYQVKQVLLAIEKLEVEHATEE